MQTISRYNIYVTQVTYSIQLEALRRCGAAPTTCVNATSRPETRLTELDHYLDIYLLYGYQSGRSVQFQGSQHSPRLSTHPSAGDHLILAITCHLTTWTMRIVPSMIRTSRIPLFMDTHGTTATTATTSPFAISPTCCHQHLRARCTTLCHQHSLPCLLPRPPSMMEQAHERE